MLTTSERVALYKKELAENGKQPVFDVYAFVFNSFYYLYYDSFRWFLLFALLPLIGMFIPGNPAFNFLSGMLEVMSPAAVVFAVTYVPLMQKLTNIIFDGCKKAE